MNTTDYMHYSFYSTNKLFIVVHVMFFYFLSILCNIKWMVVQHKEVLCTKDVIINIYSSGNGSVQFYPHVGLPPCFFFHDLYTTGWMSPTWNVSPSTVLCFSDKSSKANSVFPWSWDWIFGWCKWPGKDNKWEV